MRGLSPAANCRMLLLMKRFDKKELSLAPSALFVTGARVRFQDVDAAGIVFFARFFDYVHEAYEAFLTHIQLPLPQLLRDGKWAAPLRHAEADYFRPLNYGDLLSVRLVKVEVEASEISFGWSIFCAPGPEAQAGAGADAAVGEPYCAAVVQTAHIFVNRKTFERTKIPEEIVRKVSFS